MNRFRLTVSILLGIVACFSLAQASVPFAVFARVEKVVLEPNPDSPETIQISGVFSLADPGNRNTYLAPARGYLYFKLAANPAQARKEWQDLKNAAGTGHIVAFGSRYNSEPRLRKDNEQAKDPDAYDLNIGLTEMRNDTRYPPVRELIDFKD